MDMAEKVMQELMNDRNVSPNTRTFNALISGYLHIRGDRQYRSERMYFWLCKMRDSNLQPNKHIVKHFHKMNLYFPAVDEPFWTTDFGMPFDTSTRSSLSLSFNTQIIHYILL
jgi:hypothetical protein